MTDMNRSWRSRSACSRVIDADPVFQTAWMVKDDIGASHAKSICGSCLVRFECLIDALSDPETQGLRAGFFFDYGVVSREDAKTILNEIGVRAVTSQRENRKRIAALA